MASKNNQGAGEKRAPSNGSQVADKSAPDWANGLRQLYDSVVDEPLPDTFKDLLSKLDADSSDDGAGGTVSR